MATHRRTQGHVELRHRFTDLDFVDHLEEHDDRERSHSEGERRQDSEVAHRSQRARHGRRVSLHEAPKQRGCDQQEDRDADQDCHRVLGYKVGERLHLTDLRGD